MRECKFCGYSKINQGDLYCSNCGARFSSAEVAQIESEHVKLWGGESRIATLFFVNFINTSRDNDKLTVRKNVIYLVEAMQEIENIIVKHSGTANKILPDNRILAAFGIPITLRDDAERAFECMLAIKDYSQTKIEKNEFGDWRISMGMNRGWVFFGYVVQQLSYLTIIGDTVNVAARITQICPVDNIYLSHSAYDSIANYVDVEDAGERAVKGRAESVRIHKLLSVRKTAKSAITSKFPLFGREKEFEKLISLAQETKNNHRLRLCAITGQMGIGKTRLKEEFRERLIKDGSYRILESYSVGEINAPYHPFRQLFREYLNLQEADDHKTISNKIDAYIASINLTAQDAQGMKYLFTTDLRRVWGETMSKIQEEIFCAVKNLLKAMCRNEPLVIIFEEFNRADGVSKMLVSYLINELSEFPIMILMVNLVDEFQVGNNQPFEVINLGPLTTEHIGQIVKYILNEVDEKLVEFVHRISGGNPLFTIETIRSIQRTQLIKQKDSGQWYLEKEKKLPFLEDLYGVVMSGVDSLSSTHRLIVDYASVIGYTFTHQIISNLLANVTDLQGRLDYLRQEDYLIKFRGGNDPVYIFRHNLLRDAVYTTLPMKKRREIHKRVGELYEKVYANCLFEYYENLGQQFLSCEKYEKAAHYFKLSGDRAKTFLSIDPAMNYYNTVLRIADEHPGTVDFDTVSDCHLNLSDLYELKGDIQRMKTTAETGRENARRLNALKWDLNFVERLATAHFLLNEHAKAEELYLEAIQRCDEQMPELLSVLYTGLGVTYLARGEPEKSLLNYNLAWVTAHSNNLVQGELPCLLNLSRMHRNLGNFELSLEYLNYALNELVKDTEFLNVAQVKYLIGEIYLDLWNLDKANEFLKASFELTEQFGFETTIKSSLYLALVNAIFKKEEGVQRHLEYVDKRLSLLVREELLAEINIKKAMILLRIGQNDRAKEFTNSALKLALKLNHREFEFGCYILLAEMDRERAERHLAEALQISEYIKFPPLILRALYSLTNYYLENDDIERAHYFGQKALFIFDDIKTKLQPENREYYIKHPEYSKLLEM